jgi:hypothetical protein
MSNPFDDLETHIPGRLLAVEGLLTLILRQRTGVAKLAAQAEAIVDSIETALITKADVPASPHQLATFKVARAALDKISTEARRGR